MPSGGGGDAAERLCSSGKPAETADIYCCTHSGTDGCAAIRSTGRAGRAGTGNAGGGTAVNAAGRGRKERKRILCAFRAQCPRGLRSGRGQTESLAAMEDAWYTGGSVEEGYDYGYNGMLEIAEDNYGFASEYGGPMEMEADRTVSVVHADSDYCAFLITSYYFTGGVHGTYSTEAVCFDSQTGERLTLDSMSSDPEAFRLRLVEEMLKLVEEDKDGYYSERLSLTEPGNYATAFAALLREGSWYPGRDAFYVFSTLYELGPYAAGITEFAIPYENLKGILDERWIPRQTEEEARLRIDPVTDVPEGSVEIADLLVIGEGGETTLLICEGELTDLEVSTCSTGYDNRFYPDRELYYCGRIKNAAIQMALLMQGDLPDTMIRYRDGNGEHELLISLSGENGSYLLTENPGAQNS